MGPGRTVAKTLVGGACVAALAGACNPNGCVSEVAPTVGDLVFTSWSYSVTSAPINNGVILSKNTVPAIPNDFWGPAELGGPSPGLALTDVALSTVGISYQSAPPPAQLLRQEVNIYARDPREYADTLAGFLTDQSAWQTEVGPCALPTVLSLRYPGVSGAAMLGLPDSTPILVDTFFPNCPNVNNGSALLPSIAGPSGYGSIRAASMNDHGVCSHPFDLSGVLPALQTAIWTQFSQNVASNGQSCADAEQQWFNGSTYLSENPNLNPDIHPTGGFNMSFYFDYPLEYFQPQGNIWGNFSFQWGLNDGLLTVTSIENATQWNGSHSDSSSATLYSVLSTKIPTAIEELSLAMQANPLLPRVTCTPTSYMPSNGLPTTFNLAIGGAQFTYTPAAITDSGVALAITGLDVLISNAVGDGTFAALGLTNAPNVSGATAEEILAGTLQEPDPANPAVYHNWICVQTSSGAVGGSSGGTWVPYYVPRARRLNVYPDSVEPVWTDDLAIEIGPLTNNCCSSQCGGSATSSSCATTSALPLFVIAQELVNSGMDGGIQTFDKLCTPAVLPTTSRNFYPFTSGHMYNSYQNLVNCAVNQLGDFITSNPAWDTAITAYLCLALYPGACP